MTTPGGSVPPVTTIVPPAEPLSPVTIPPELAGDPRAPILFDPSPDDGGEVPFFQGMFDPGTNEVLEGKVSELKAEVLAKQRLLGELQAEVLAQRIKVDELTDRIEELGTEAQRNVEAAAAAERELRDHTVEAFISGSSEERITLVRSGDPVKLGVARELLDSVVDTDEEVIDRHDRAQAALDAEQRELAAALDEAEQRLDELDQAYTAAVAAMAVDEQALAAYEAGSQVYVKGFVFPVQGPVEFIDSWGYPRMTGTASAHWHQGTDIFAPLGTPLVASESGEVSKVGQAGLGGNRLWLRGDSGTDYYYAHLVGFATGMADGVRVNAGDVVGYVGDTGNAKGTSPHLHFQVHPNGEDADPVNPYPLLKATYGNKPMVQIVQAPPATVPPPVDPATGLPTLPVAPAVAPAAAPGG